MTQLDNSYKNVLQKIAIWLTSIFMSFTISALFVYFIVSIATFIYKKKYPQILGQEDMALGMTVVFWFAAGCLFALPICVGLTLVFKKSIYKYLVKG